MKAIVYTEYGSPEVLHVAEREKPVPKDNQVLIKVHASTVNYGDLIARDFKNITSRTFNMPYLFLIGARLFFGTKKPKIHILGSEFSGEVEATGKAVTHFQKGDPVFGYVGQNMGAYAEYLCVPESGTLAAKPTSMTFEEAAAVPYGAIMALHLLEKMNIQPKQKVLIIGASGGIGSAAVQIAKHHFGAQVTGVCGTPRIEFVKSLGADAVIDYKKEDFSQNSETFDLVFDVLGTSSFSSCTKVLKKNGTYLRASFKTKQLLQMLWTKIIGSKKVVCAIAPGRQDDLKTVKSLIEAGKIKTIIDRTFPMEQAAEAHRYVEDGHKKGHVVISIGR
jgi:NADPH:quinone reductase-like Zn-dependent oxidoreductase